MNFFHEEEHEENLLYCHCTVSTDSKPNNHRLQKANLRLKATGTTFLPLGSTTSPIRGQ